MKQVIIILLFLALVSSSSEWDTFKGSLERTGASDSPAPDTMYLQWKVDLESALYSSPVIQNEKVFQVAFEKVVCINMHTGDIEWISSLPAYNSTPTVTDDRIIVATNRGISAVAVEDGDPLWEYMVSGRFSKMELVDYIVSPPAISNGNVIVGTRPYSYWHVDAFEPYEQNELFLVCLDEATGEEEWYEKTNLGVFSAPCVAYGKVFVASREILCIDIGSGEILWDSEDKYPYSTKRPLEERYAFDYSTPALYHGILIGGSCDMTWSHKEPKYIGVQKIVSMDQYTGDVLWEWTEEGFLASSPVIYEGRIYFYSYDGMVRCLSLLDGKELWETSISEPQEFEDEYFRLWPSPSAADGKVYIGSCEGLLDLVNDHRKEIEEREEEFKEAESLMDKADEILWDNQFIKAKTLYEKAGKIHKELGNEFGVSFCETRIAYIQGKIPEDERESRREYTWIAVIVIYVASAAILFKKVST